jgi:hypothetical protein
LSCLILSCANAVGNDLHIENGPTLQEELAALIEEEMFSVSFTDLTLGTPYASGAGGTGLSVYLCLAYLSMLSLCLFVYT